MTSSFQKYKDPKEALGFDKKTVIEDWLKSYNVTNYFVTRRFMIDVYSNVDLVNKDLTNLPHYIQFRKILGSFNISHNKLTSLKGCPHRVKASFYCNNNELDSLEFGPIQVEGSYLCHQNNINSLKFLPEHINNLSCSDNLLKTLKFIPEEIHGDLHCHNNNLISIDDFPNRIDGDLYISFAKYKKFSIEDIRNKCYVERIIHII